MNTSCWFLLAPLCGLLWAGTARAAQEAPPERAGLPIGEKAPAFTLKDQSGNEATLASWLKKGPVALVFYRSADW